ncbi:MAG: hypothetical protein ACR2PL_00325, partial [Dehalococcoidia bacterium]
MTSTAVNKQDLLARVHDAGYWRIVMHPASFEEHRISSGDACWQIIRSAQVTLRGWDYPQLNLHYHEQGDDWIQSGIEYADHVEFWRFYQSGQFIQHLAVTSDREPPSLHGPRTESSIINGPRQMDFVEAVYTLTEILEFASRLAYRDVLAPVANLLIELHGMTGRFLAASPDRMGFIASTLLRPFQSQVETIYWRQTVQAIELIADAPRIAIEAAIHIF